MILYILYENIYTCLYIFHFFHGLLQEQCNFPFFPHLLQDFHGCVYRVVRWLKEFSYVKS